MNGVNTAKRPAFLVGLKQRQDLSEKGRIVAAGGRDVVAPLGRGQLKRAGENPTSERVVDALETIHHFDLGTGAALTFTGSEHQASHKVWGTILDKAGNFKVLDMTE